VKRRLLIDSTVLEFLGSLRKRDREFLLTRFEAIRDFPAHHADYVHRGENGRTLDGHIAGRFAIIFWDDAADHHLKIMGVTWADDVQ
jgi:mRNA-degrading endonuclease RelE of RelBE toxin-antitoxin system